MTEPAETGTSLYAQAGVDTLAKAGGLADIGDRVRATFSYRSGLGRPLLPLGYFANVIDLADGRGLAISTDNVGTKVLVAQMMGRYDTVGIDCVAINVNDLLCVGAEPLSLVDYIAAERADQEQLAQIAAGLCEGARQARISISGGETAQVAELVRGAREGYGFDLSGTCVGLVDLDRLVVGRHLAPGDAVIGMASSGIHSNGLTLARRLFFDKLGYSVTQHLPALGRSIGDELLEPTRIYVPAALEMLERLDVKSMAHITGDGLTNLLRVDSELGFVIDDLPDPPPIFELIQEAGEVPPHEMYEVFNMGIGFCAVVPAEQAEEAIAISRRHDTPAWRIGNATDEFSKQVRLTQPRLIGENNRFRPAP